MLTPEIDGTKKSLQSNASAATTVTDYAQATVTAVPEVAAPPDWFEPMQNDLAISKEHAQSWLKKICPAITKGIPQGVIDFNQTFQTMSQQILDLQQAIENGGGKPTADQRSSVDSLLVDLSTRFGSQADTVASLQTDLKTYSAQIKTDQDKLSSDLGAVSQRFTSGHTWIQELTEAIGDSFLDSQVLGPCIAIVNIKMDITLKVGGVEADPTLITLIFAKAILENQIGNSQTSQQAVQDILDVWATLKVKADAVASDLKDAKDSEYTNVLSQIDLETARTQWQQLSDFATELIQQT